MIEVVLYTLIEFLNFYLAYRSVFGIRFTKNKLPYVVVVVCACVVQILVWYLVDNTWRDVIAIGTGLIGAIIVTDSKRWKTIMLYPAVFFLSSFINIMGSHGVAALLDITQEAVADSMILTLISECTAVIIFLIYDAVIRKKGREELPLTAGQYMILLAGGVCFFIIITFSQGLLQEKDDVINKMGDLTAVASVLIALFFIILCVWQQITWKRALQYRIENERYEMFLAGQEEHIRMLMIEDENRRKLRHDMNAHMLALDTMAAREEWEMLKEYLKQMEECFGEVSVNRYTLLSAVDAIIDEWRNKAIEHHVKWNWEGTLKPTDRVTMFELCTVFSNLLSNAVEAVGKIERERIIEVKVSDFQGKIIIFIRNTCDIDGIFQNRPVTTKADKVFHGLGLKNVEEIIKKHEGSISYEMRDGWFQVNIVL